MDKYEKLGLNFGESMSGWIGVGYTDPVEGRVCGEIEKTDIVMDMTITIDSLSRFLNDDKHAAKLEGKVRYKPAGGEFDIQNGVFNLFAVDSKTGRRQMTYKCNFTNKYNEVFYLEGHKDIFDDPGFDVLEDMTTMFTHIYKGKDENAPIFGAGQLFFKLSKAPSLLTSMKITGDAWWGQRMAAKMAFLSFAYGALRDEYLRDVSLFYDSGYQNLAIAGEDFFFVSGVHDKDFPWGDQELFTDILLLIRQQDGSYRRFGITKRILETLHINVRKGTYTYEGDLYEIVDGYSASFSDIEKNRKNVVKYQASIDLKLKAQAFGLTPFPFRIFGDLFDKFSTAVSETLRRILPSEHLLGFNIIPHSVREISGEIKLKGPEGNEISVPFTPDKTSGEAELSTIKNIREPTLLYGYICAIRPKEKVARVQIHANSFRNDRPYWGKDRLDAFIGSVVSHLTSKEILVREDGITVTDLEECDTHPTNHAQCFKKIGKPLLELTNDQYPTADFQRRIIEVKDPSGEKCLALEEDMDALRRESLNVPPGTPAVTVASIRGEDKVKCLDEVLEKAKFFETLEAKRKASGLPAEEFSIVIKPNFMFTYNKADHTTFTDPDLVKHLVKKLRALQYKKICVVEAQSTYGQYFNRRSVREVAEYIGYDLSGDGGYEVVDMTLDIDKNDHRDFGPKLGRSPVCRTWRDANFRISFAKNKTHCYAFYTLTLKNIYGALPKKNKFKEYHCGEGIYEPTIEYLEAFPIDFGLIDAFSSADGPFGIFADSEPNPTQTVIGGANIVAVDWVGASKMGIDPKISEYMKLAVSAFGKPEIDLIGDANPYRPWLNVPMVMTLFTHFGLDANYYMGNIFYMVGSYMDESYFTHKSRAQFIRIARRAIKPIQEAVFLQAGGERSRANKALSHFLTWLGK